MNNGINQANWFTKYTIIGHVRGWEIFWDWNTRSWFYADNGNPYDSNRPCKNCGKEPTIEDYDACLGYLPGVKHACCGHGGIQKSYIIREVICQN